MGERGARRIGALSAERLEPAEDQRQNGETGKQRQGERGLDSLRKAGRELSPVLAACQGQLEEAARRPGQPVRTAGQEIHFSTPTANPGLDPCQPDAYPLPFELLRDPTRPEPATTLGTRLLSQFDHRLCPRLEGVTHHGGWGI